MRGTTARVRRHGAIAIPRLLPRGIAASGVAALAEAVHLARCASHAPPRRNASRQHTVLPIFRSARPTAVSRTGERVVCDDNDAVCLLPPVQLARAENDVGMAPILATGDELGVCARWGRPAGYRHQLRVAGGVRKGAPQSEHDARIPAMATAKRLRERTNANAGRPQLGVERPFGRRQAMRRSHSCVAVEVNGWCAACERGPAQRRPRQSPAQWMPWGGNAGRY